MSLSSLIVQREIATIRQVEEALARQVLYGGDLVTNLLEVAKVDEPRLLAVVGESANCRVATLDSLLQPSREALALIPTEMAIRRSMVPLAIEGGDRLIVGISEPLSHAEEEELAFALGMRVESRIALYPRIREAIAQVYGVPIDRRLERLFGKGALAEKALEPRSSMGPVTHETAITRPNTVPPYRLSQSYGPPSGAARSASRIPTATGFPAPNPGMIDIASAPSSGKLPFENETATVPPPEKEEVTARLRTSDYLLNARAQLGATPSVTRTAMRSSPHLARRRRGPVTFEAAKEELAESANRDALLDLFFDFARQFFDYSAIFIVHGSRSGEGESAEIAEGRDAFGTGAPREIVREIGIPLALPNMFTLARDSKEPYFSTISHEGADAAFVREMQRKTGFEVMVLPILVRSRAVALLYGDSGESGVDRTTIRDVLTMAQLVGQGFEKLIVRKKLAGFQAASPGDQAGKFDGSAFGSVSKNPSVAPPSPNAPEMAIRSAALSRALRTSSRPGAFRAVEEEPKRPATNPETPMAMGSIPPALEHSESAPPAPPVAAVASPVSERLIQPRPRVPMRPSKPPPKGLEEVRILSGPPIPREENDDARPAPLTNPRERETPNSSPHIEAAPFTDEDAALLAEIAEAEASNFPPETRLIVEDDDQDADEDEPPVLSVAVPPRRPPPSSQNLLSSLPSVIIDVDGDVVGHVDRVLSGEDDGVSEGELLRQGLQAMPAIMMRFPGPVAIDRLEIGPGGLGGTNGMGGSLPRASECGPVLRLVARQRRVALPFVLRAATSDDAATRFWATFLLSELAYVEGVPTVITRLHDLDPRVRLAARAAARAMSEVAHDVLLAEIGKVLRDPNATRSARIGVLEALGEMREPLAVPVLMRSLADEDEEIATVARRSLIAVTRRDFQRDEKKWLAWWGQHSTEHRIEWLIDALTDDTPGIRRAAGEELKTITGETLGYYDDLPKRERERAQQRFRDWWDQEGKTRFLRT